MIMNNCIKEQSRQVIELMKNLNEKFQATVRFTRRSAIVLSVLIWILATLMSCVLMIRLRHKDVPKSAVCLPTIMFDEMNVKYSQTFDYSKSSIPNKEFNHANQSSATNAHQKSKHDSKVVEWNLFHIVFVYLTTFFGIVIFLGLLCICCINRAHEDRNSKYFAREGKEQLMAQHISPLIWMHFCTLCTLAISVGSQGDALPDYLKPTLMVFLLPSNALFDFVLYFISLITHKRKAKQQQIILKRLKNRLKSCS